MGNDEVLYPGGLHLLVKTDASCQGVRSRSEVNPLACSLSAQPYSDPLNQDCRWGHLTAPRAPWSIPQPQENLSSKSKQTHRNTHSFTHANTHVHTFICAYGYIHRCAPNSTRVRVHPYTAQESWDNGDTHRLAHLGSDPRITVFCCASLACVFDVSVLQVRWRCGMVGLSQRAVLQTKLSSQKSSLVLTWPLKSTS